MGVQQVSSRAEVFGEWLASRPVGQFVFRSIDSVLRLVEKSLMWSTQPAQPSEGTSESGTGGSLVVVARPLSWPLFLPLLGFLGVIRVTVYYVTRIFRKPRDTKDIIMWLQTKRRHLRAIRFAGIKNMRYHQDDTLTVGQQTTPGRTPIKTPNGKAPVNTSEPGDSPDQEKKRKYCDVEQSDCADSSDDEGVAVKLDKNCENYDSESDPDFEPSSEGESSEDDDSGEGEDEEDLEKEVVKKSEGTVSSSVETPISSPSIVTVEPQEMELVSENGQFGEESPSSAGSSLTSPAQPSSASKFVKFFRRSRKAKQPL